MLHALLRSLALALFLVLFKTNAEAQDATTVATLYSLEGTAEKRVTGKAEWAPCSQGEVFNHGDEIKVGAISRAGIQFQDGLFVRLSSKASLRFAKTGAAPSGNLYLNSGKAHFFNREATEGPRIETSVVTAAVRGTEFVVTALPTSTIVTVLEGQVVASNQFGSVDLAHGEQALTEKGSAPRKTVLIDSAAAVQWTAEVPVFFDWEAYALESSTESIRSAVGQQRYGDALAALAKLPSVSSVGAQLLRTDLFLALGQIDEAVNTAAPGASGSYSARQNAHASAQQSLIALARNDAAKAEEFATAGHKLDGASPAAFLALSYVLQAQRNLEDAREAVTAALRVAPQSPLLLARQAELELGFGDADAAEEHARAALQLAPNFGYAESVLGFVALSRSRADDAKQHFSRAIAHDSGSGLPFLGLGLAKIHDGDLEGGRIDIQRAVHLEPSRAIFRSYLGKAFFELESEDAAAREYNEAIRLDPEDPTPWLYRGFYHLSKNRVVNALEDVEQSFQLNDNRAVFRSSLLLDQDTAVRSAGLSRVFTELGFDERGRIEAIEALSRDPANFSAHRLLADSQQQIFLADASFSERRIADLLAPLSFNLFSALGGQASLNEYDALFDMSQRRFGTVVGYDQRSDALFGEASYSGKQDNIGYALGTSFQYGGGRKKRDYARDYRLDGALRAQLAPEHRILLDAHGIYRKENDFLSEPQEMEFKLASAGVGYSYRAGPELTVIAETVISRERTNNFTSGAFETIDSTQIFDGLEDTLADDLIVDQSINEYVTVLRGGSQALYDSEHLSFVAGFQLLHENPDRADQKLVLEDSLGELTGSGLELLSASSAEISASDFYFYPTWHATNWLDVTAGVTRTDIDQEYTEVPPFAPGESPQSHWSPKAGMTARPTSRLTLRAAYFESLKKSSLEDQISLEPTLVGGIPQRFNDLSGTKSRNLGFGADYKIPGSTYFGAEYIRRYPLERRVDTSTELVADFDIGEIYSVINVTPPYDLYLEQDYARAYFYQVLDDSFVATLDYLYGTEEITDPDLSSDFLMHKLSGQIRYFHGSGFFSWVRATWRKQTGIENLYLPEDGKEIAWVFDAAVGYRLPKRRGSLRIEFLNLGGERFTFDQTRGFEDFVKPDFAIRAVAALNF